MRGARGSADVQGLYVGKIEGRGWRCAALSRTHRTMGWMHGEQESEWRESEDGSLARDRESDYVICTFDSHSLTHSLTHVPRSPPSIIPPPHQLACTGGSPMIPLLPAV